MGEEIQFVCKYCDYHWNDMDWNIENSRNQICNRCKSRNVRVKRKSREKIDAYAPKLPKRNVDED